jgi:radical SAM protein with 4Fe4S-binding SPASM domain
MMKEKFISFDQWKQLFKDLSMMGISKITMSGGEPTLYKKLPDLIKEAKTYDWEVRLNTNGSLINNSLAEKLLDAGLDCVSVSIYSASPEVHDAMRRRKGLWEKSVQALKYFSELRDNSFPQLRLNIQTILTKKNFRKFPQFLSLAYQLRACNLTLSYLEGDYVEKRQLLNPTEIIEFKNKIIPETAQAIHESPASSTLKRISKRAVESLYPEKTLSLQDYAEGVYRPASPCLIPTYFALILSNGDVIPCTMVLYTHSPVVGNVLEQSISEIWSGSAFDEFRNKGFLSCQYCPMSEHVTIPITRKPELANIQKIFPKSSWNHLYPYLKKVAYSKRRLLQILRHQ